MVKRNGFRKVLRYLRHSEQLIRVTIPSCSQAFRSALCNGASSGVEQHEGKGYRLEQVSQRKKRTSQLRRWRSGGSFCRQMDSDGWPFRSWNRGICQLQYPQAIHPASLCRNCNKYMILCLLLFFTLLTLWKKVFLFPPHFSSTFSRCQLQRATPEYLPFVLAERQPEPRSAGRAQHRKKPPPVPCRRF